MKDREFERIERQIGHSFSDRALLAQALTHRSAGSPHNERFEFLGDSVLGFVVSNFLFRLYPGAPEAELTLMRAQLVKRESLARVAQRIALGDALRFSTAVASAGVHRRSSVLADGLEAVIGAVYLDAGPLVVEAVIERLLHAELRSLDAQSLKDAKTTLQEFLQAQAQALPTYTIVATLGQEHARTYQVCCSARDGVTAVGQGRSRRAAEQDAALKVLAQLQPEHPLLLQQHPKEPDGDA
jgi:ribonuclease-3